MALLGNPFLRKTVRIVVPRVSKKKVPDNSIVNVFYLRSGYSVVGFGVCLETNDVKLLMVNSSIPTRWVVKVFTLSSRAWRSLSFDPPFKSCDLSWDHVSLNGFIYLHGYDDCKLTTEIRSNVIASFDLKTEMWTNASSQYHSVWMIKDATTKSFTKIFIVKPRGPSVRRGLLGFRKNGEAILAILADLDDDDDDTKGSSLLEVYDPCSGRINDTGIGGIESLFSEVANGLRWHSTMSKPKQTVWLSDLPPAPAPAAEADAQALADWDVLFYRYNEVTCLMLGTMSPKLYKHFEHNSPLEMNMQSMEKTISEIHSLLIEIEKSIKRNKQPIVGASSTPQGLRGAKKLKHGSFYLYVGNGVRVEVEAIGSFELVLPNGLIIVLDYCHYAPSITRGVVSVSYLVDKGFTQCFTDFGLSVSMNNMLYFNAITANGIYESDMRDSTLPIVNSIHVSKKGVSYFITFTDDYSRYVYVYLLKRKHEVFETFKVFKSEVENQLGKTIKAIRSDRGGCPKETMGYYLYYPSENKIVVERYADFLEKDFILQKESGRIVELEDEDILPSKNTSEHPIEEESFAPIVSQEEDVIPVRRSVRTHKAPHRLCLNVEIDPDRLCFNVEVEEHSLGDLNEPANYKAALSDPEFEKWLVAINAKMQSMYDNKVWRLVVLPPNAKVVKSKWIYKKKTDMDGKVHIYKAQLVAKVCTQTYGVDYEETFSLVADIRAIRILIAISAYYDFKIWQMDVKNVFLNGFLEEEIYMEQPEGFIDPNHPRKASGSNVIFLILYVDDIILMGNHIPSLQEVKTYLGKCFSMKDLGEAAFILGIQIYRDRSMQLIGLSQNAYLDKILKRYRMDHSKRGSIPMQVDLHLSKSQCATISIEMKRMQNVSYSSANSGEAHWTAVKNILKYLRNTKDAFLVYGGAMVWKSSKQSTTAQHATEAEYIAASKDAKEAVWIRKFIDELRVVPSNDYLIKMNCENSAAIIMAKESGIQKGARHFKRKYHYVRESTETSEIDIVKVHTDDNLADPFTNDLASPKLTLHVRSMGLRPASSFM
nr:hypothetical protein [Tanacetum cinerariifolium]